MSTNGLREFDINRECSFRDEARRLKNALREVAIGIEHVGSTAVHGMPGKGIVDILVTVAALEPSDTYGRPLQAIGYVQRPVTERPDSPFFTRPAVKPRTHNVHIAVAGGRRARSLIDVRDYLRTHPDEAAAYERHKRSILERTGGDWSAYSRDKRSFVSALDRRAGLWAKSAGGDR